jgi:monoamine oxidase
LSSVARTDFDVVVVGAGLAGLHAAATLEGVGMRVLVLEAQRRVGGRIHSMKQQGGTAEAGGTYIGAGYERVIAAAQRHGVELMDVTPVLEFFREQDLALDGEIIRQAEWPTHPKNEFPQRDKEHLPWNYHRVLTMRDNPLHAPSDWLDARHAALDVSAHAWLRGLGLSERAIALAYGLNVSFGRDAHDVSALLLLFRGAFSREQRARSASDSLGFTARHGVQLIPDAMAAALSVGVELEHAVSAIALDRDGAAVSCVNGRRFTARHVVAAVPPPVLRRIAIEPALPRLQAEAIATLPSQPLTQVYLAPRSRFWEQDGYAASLFTDTRAGMLAAARNRDDPTEVTSITAWITGDNAAALDRLPAADAGRSVIAAIETLRPSAKGQLELMGMHSWGADAYAGGAWAYFRPGEVTRFASVLGRAHGRLHFCGEHLATASRGMEGAMESADEAAAAILENG